MRAEASAAKGLRPIVQVAHDLGLSDDEVIPYGARCAKVPLSTLEAASRRPGPKGRIVLITSLTPTPHGEGKTVTSIGLAMALRRLGVRSTVCLRQPALGPTLGLKGGGAGGGRAAVEPTALLNLGFPGDTACVGSAHNLLSALLDNHLVQGGEPRVDPARVLWPRTVDLDDRALRHVTVGQGGPKDGVPRPDSFVITAASEVMAVLGLSRDFKDLKERLSRILVGRTAGGDPVVARDLKASGAMAALLRDALYPNLVQTSEGTPALVHTGPFANIAHGTASRVSIQLARTFSEVCLVEGGFASDLGAEKFVDLVTPLGEFSVDAAVVVATLPALRHHGGAAPDRLSQPDLPAVERGLENLGKHLENVRTLGLRAVVAVNRFPGDTPEELRRLAQFCEAQGVRWAESTAFADGGAGVEKLAELVLEAAKTGSACKPLYGPGGTPEQKLDLVARQIYGADGVDLSPEARRDVEDLRALACEGLPVCVAKTPLSLSDDPKRPGRPRGFRVLVRRIRPSLGAGFLVAETGTISLMPGLPSVPAALGIDLSDHGEITGVR